MDFFDVGDHITVKDLNAITYLLRKFKRLNTGLKLGSLTLESDYGSFVFDKPLTSVGGNFIIESEVNVSSNDCLKNCFYSFVFNVIDVNTSGTVNKRQVKVTGGTGDDGALFVTLPTDLIESDEVILPDFELDIVFDEHEYYTPVVDVVNVELVSDKRFVGVGETATVTATLSDRDGELLVGVPCNFLVNGVTYSEVTDSNGQAEWEYTGTGVSSKIDIRVVTTRLTIYDSVMTATVTGSSVRLGQNMIATGDILIDWGDGTTTTKYRSGGMESHTYTDGLNEHTIAFIGEITSLGDSCFINCTGLTSITIPNSVTSLGYFCFYNCTGLTSIDIPSSVTSLGDSCFNECTGLTSIEIPSSVTSLGNYCFDRCFSLVDYQLYWKDTAIIEYNSYNMPVKADTYFTIPQGQRTQYLNKNYPNKIKIRGYDLSITTDKTIIETDETSTVTATLTYNMEPISDETVSYTIRQGATVIDTGSDTTDSNGQIEVEYTGTSIGKINIIFTYDTLTETSIIYDTIEYDNATSTDYNDLFNITTGITRQTTNTRINRTSQVYLSLQPINNGVIYEFDLDSVTSGRLQIARYETGKTTTYHNINLKSKGVGHYTVESLPDSLVFKKNGNVVLTVSSPPRENTRLFFTTDNDLLDLTYRNLKVYCSEGSSKVETSLSISSDKASYYTDESIVLTGTLVDDDNQPLVDADVKVYRGASLVDTVSTDSSGIYEKSVTGLSAGSYSFKAVYDGDEVYQASTSSSLSVIVQNHSYSLSISSDKQIILTTESVTISGQLLKDSTAFTGQSVALYDGATIVDTLTTDGSGNYSKTLTGLSVGTHTFKAVNSNAESSTISITVNEPTPVHDYSLSVASTKDILSYADSESATLTATLTDNGSAVSGESLSYVIKHGSTTISTGSDTTDSNGQISFNYTSTGIGKITIEVNYGSLLQERYELIDSQFYDTGVTGTTASYGLTRLTKTVGDNNTLLTSTGNYAHLLVVSSSKRFQLPFKIEFDLDETDDNSGAKVNIYDDTTNMYFNLEETGHYILNISESEITGTVDGRNVTHTNATPNAPCRVSFYLAYTGDTLKFKNFVIYSVPTNDYSLSVASSKDILSYEDHESATLTATLLDNNVAVSGETLSYTVKHGATVLDTGSDTTDSNGQISFTYASTGIGDITVEVDYGILLQERYDVIDYVSYDDATTDKASKYTIANLNSHTFSTDHYVAERTLSASASATYYSLVHETYNLPTDFEASVDLLVTNKSTSDHQFGLCISPDYPETYSGTNQCFLYSNRNRFALGYRINGSLSNYGTYNSDFSTNTWYTFYIKVQGTTVTTTIKQGSNTIQSYTGTHSNIQSWKKLMLVIGGNSNNMHWKNLKIKAL